MAFFPTLQSCKWTCTNEQFKLFKCDLWNYQQRTTARERVKAAFLPVKLLAVIKAADSWNRHRSSHNEIRRLMFRGLNPSREIVIA
jgi:hypothetical protein